MSFLKRMGLFSRAEASIDTLTSLRLESVRFRKLLALCREMMDLAQDGQEKYRGEYILDRHYVITLVDAVLDRLSSFTTNSLFLLPEQADKRFETLDVLKKHAVVLEKTGNLVPRLKPSESEGSPESSPHQEPEYQLLAKALQWMDGGELPEDEDVLHWVLDLLERMVVEPTRPVADPSGLTTLELDTQCTNNRIEFADLTLPSGADTSSTTESPSLHCRPFVLMLIGAEEDEKKEDNSALSSEEATKRFQNWFAVADADHLDLRRVGTTSPLRLVASISGHEASDFIFLYGPRDQKLEERLGDAFRVQTTGRGFMAWMVGESPDETERNLIQLGKQLFAPSEKTEHSDGSTALGTPNPHGVG